MYTHEQNIDNHDLNVQSITLYTINHDRIYGMGANLCNKRRNITPKLIGSGGHQWVREQDDTGKLGNNYLCSKNDWERHWI